eukprot:8537427-Lingulodinium_polyedra.AAC.1
MLLAGSGDRGYDCKVFVLTIADFGVPHIKKGMYMLALLRFGHKCQVKCAAEFERVLRLLELSKIAGPSLPDV